MTGNNLPALDALWRWAPGRDEPLGSSLPLVLCAQSSLHPRVPARKKTRANSFAWSSWLLSFDTDSVAEAKIVQNLLQLGFHVLGERRADAHREFDAHAEVIPGP